MGDVSRRTMVTGAVGLAGAAVLGPVLAGCTSAPAAEITPSAPAGAPGTTTPAPSPTPLDPRPRWPLTGVLLENAADAERPVVAVKVPDNKGEHPQKGINEADIVFVQLDGYLGSDGQSGTRLAPVFHSQYAADVAPVRSIRPVDIPLLSPMDAIIANTGAAGWTLKYFKKNAKGLDYAQTYMATKGTGSYSIDGSRVRTLDGKKYYDRAVVCHPEKLLEQSKITTTPQVPYFPFAVADEVPSTEASGSAAASVSVPWKKGDSYNTGYTWSEKQQLWLRSTPWGKHVLSNGDRVTTENVLVIQAKQRFEHHEPFHDVTGKKGTFYYFHGGKYVKGTWSKAEDVDSLFEFTLDDGSPLRMAPGRTFVELPNTGTTIGIKA